MATAAACTEEAAPPKQDNPLFRGGFVADVPKVPDAKGDSAALAKDAQPDATGAAGKDAVADAKADVADAGGAADGEVVQDIAPDFSPAPDGDGATLDTESGELPAPDVPPKPCLPGIDECDDLNPCTLDSCNADTSTCLFAPAGTNGKPCNADDSGCTQTDSCQAGKCTPGAPPDCALTTTEPCIEGVCSSTGKFTFDCKAKAKAKGAVCDDGQFCTDPDPCDGAGKCGSGPPKLCADGSGCQTATCDEGQKKCLPAPKPDGTLCDDGDACTSPDACKAGICQAGGTACGDVKASAFKATAGSVRQAAVGDLGGGRWCAAWPGEGGTVWTRAWRADGSREASEQLVATAPTGEALVHVAVLPAGGGASDVLWASDGPGKVEACWYAKFANLCQTTCFTSQAACGNVYSLSSCVQGTRHTPATHIQWQRIDALLQPQGGPVSVLQASVGCTIGAPAPALSAVVAVALEDGKRFVAWTTPQGTHKVLLQAGGAIIKSLGVEPKQKNPAVAAFSDGRVLLAWDDGEDVWAQMYASSGDKDGTPFPVNAQAAGKQWGPVVAALPNGRSVVAWNTDAGEGDVRAQMFKQEPGLPLGAEFQVNTSAPGPQGKPAIAVHADGTFAIAFEDGANGDGSGWGIAAHWFSPTGVKVGGPKVIDTTTTGDQRLPAAVGAGDAAVFVWTNLNGGHVYLRRHDKTGATLPGTPEVVVNQQKQGDQSAPALATWSGGLAVAWESDGQDGDGAAIVWRRFNESAVAAGPETLVNTTKAGPQLHVALGADKEGNVVAVWDSFNQDGDLEAVVLQRFGKDGQKLGGEVVVNQQTLNEQQRPAVAVLPNGKTVVAWESFAQKGGQSYDVVARCYDEQGVAFGAEAIVNEQAGDKQLAPQLAPFSDDSGKVLLVWQSYGEDGSEWGVYGQLLYQTCAKVGPPFAVNSFKTGEQSQPRAAVAADGSFTVAWRSADQDGSGFGVFAQAFDKNAQKVGAEFKWNLVTADEQSRPAIAATGGLWLAAWQTIGEDEAGMAIKASVRTGKAQQGADFMANLTFTGNQSLPAVAALPSGAVAIAWASQGQDGDKGAAVVRVLKP